MRGVLGAVLGTDVYVDQGNCHILAVKLYIYEKITEL